MCGPSMEDGSTEEKLMNSMARIRTAMEHNIYLKKYVPVVKKSRLIHILHYMAIRRERKYNQDKLAEFNLFCEKNQDKLDRVFELLEDKESKLTWNAIIEFRKTWDEKIIKDRVYYPQYFVKEIFGTYKDDIFVDGGAYTGDTITSFLENGGGIAKKIYAWEPDSRNADICLNTHKDKVNLEIVPYALYRECTELLFSGDGNGLSAVHKGNSRVKAQCIDNMCTDATFIKMDIEGAEMDALYGAKETIISNKPKLAICIYHKPEHLYEIPLLIHEWVPEYKLYIRHHSDGAAESVVYARL